MIEKFKLFVLNMMYKYHNRKAEEYYEKIEGGCVSEDSGECYEKYAYHARQEFSLFDKIYQLKGI